MAKKYSSFYQHVSILLWISMLLISCNDSNKGDAWQVFRYNQDTDITSLDPAFARNQGNIWAVSQLYNGLVSLDVNLQIVPEIAERWEISEKGTEYTFYLRRGVHFHGNPEKNEKIGREVKAQDFVNSFFRIIDPVTASPGAWIFNGKVLMKNDSTVSDTCFKAVSDYILKIYLQKPFPPFLHLLTMPYAFVVPIEVVSAYGKEFRKHPVGTGPFQLQVWEEKSALIFAKNQNYWKKDSSGNSLPYIDKVHISFINDRNLAFMEFRQGKLDFISGLDENSRDIVFDGNGNIKENFGLHYQITVIPYMNTEYLGIQTDPQYYTDQNHILLKPAFRKALNYSVDKEQMVQYILNNLGSPGNGGFVPPFLLQNQLYGYTYNPEKAKKYLDSSNYFAVKDKYKIKLSTISRFPYKEIAEYLQREWSKVGIEIEVETLDNSTLLENIAQGRIRFFRASWLGDYSDAENYLACFYSKNFSPGGPNKTHYKNETFDRLYEQSLIERDDFKRKELYTQMDKLLLSDAPVIVLWYDKVVRITQKRVKGLEVNAMNSLFLEKVKLTEEK